MGLARPSVQDYVLTLRRIFIGRSLSLRPAPASRESSRLLVLPRFPDGSPAPVLTTKCVLSPRQVSLQK